MLVMKIKYWLSVIVALALAAFAIVSAVNSPCNDIEGGIYNEDCKNYIEPEGGEIDLNVDDLDNLSTDKIKITDGIKHSVPMDKILNGGPKKDGIPPIDNPKFISVTDADELYEDDGMGISVRYQNVHRFYPFQVLVWHEIVNDTIGDQPMLITYCPLCGTGVVFDPIVNGEPTEFGTSGKLYQSNLVMYDRQTDSYWSQVLGEAIVGEMTGVKLKLLPHDNMTYGEWKNTLNVLPDNKWPDPLEEPFPNPIPNDYISFVEVLSTDTGKDRDYTSTPYVGYEDNKAIYFPVDNEDDRYHPKTPMLGVEVDGVYKAYVLEDLIKAGQSSTDHLYQFVDHVGSVPLDATFDKNNETVEFVRLDTKEDVVPLYGFWFSWFSVHPDTEVYTP